MPEGWQADVRPGRGRAAYGWTRQLYGSGYGKRTGVTPHGLKARDGGCRGPSTPKLKWKAKVGDIRSGKQFGRRRGKRADSSHDIECSLIKSARARASFDLGSFYHPIRGDLDTHHHSTTCLAGDGLTAATVRLVDLRNEC